MKFKQSRAFLKLNSRGTLLLPRFMVRGKEKDRERKKARWPERLFFKPQATTWSVWHSLYHIFCNYDLLSFCV